VSDTGSPEPLVNINKEYCFSTCKYLSTGTLENIEGPDNIHIIEGTLK
jgi:hypothetical protein